MFSATEIVTTIMSCNCSLHDSNQWITSSNNVCLDSDPYNAYENVCTNDAEKLELCSSIRIPLCQTTRRLKKQRVRRAVIHSLLRQSAKRPYNRHVLRRSDDYTRVPNPDVGKCTTKVRIWKLTSVHILVRFRRCHYKVNNNDGYCAAFSSLVSSFLQ